MKQYLMSFRHYWRLSLLILLSSACLSIANETFAPFDGPIRFKGITKANTFESSDFKVKELAGNFVISAKRHPNYTLEATGMYLHDMSFSSSKGSFAASLRSRRIEDSSKALIVVNPLGKSIRINYKGSNMTGDYAWIEEIAAVSAAGTHVLCKCVKMVSQPGGRKVVNHDWVILSVMPSSLKVVVAAESFDAWAEFSSR